MEYLQHVDVSEYARLSIQSWILYERRAQQYSKLKQKTNLSQKIINLVIIKILVELFETNKLMVSEASIVNMFILENLGKQTKIIYKKEQQEDMLSYLQNMYYTCQNKYTEIFRYDYDQRDYDYDGFRSLITLINQYQTDILDYIEKNGSLSSSSSQTIYSVSSQF